MTIKRWYDSIIHALMTEIFPVSNKVINPFGRSYTGPPPPHRQCQFDNRRVWDEAINVCIQLDECSTCIYITGILLKRLIHFRHILFNYFCQNRIFSSSKLICPSSVNIVYVGVRGKPLYKNNMTWAFINDACFFKRNDAGFKWRALEPETCKLFLTLVVWYK